MLTYLAAALPRFTSPAARLPALQCAFGAGGRATLRRHVQSAGSAAAAYAVTCAATAALQQLAAAPGAVLEQAVYLSASALAGIARFAAPRPVAFAPNRTQAAATVRTTRPLARGGPRHGPAGSTTLCHAA